MDKKDILKLYEAFLIDTINQATISDVDVIFLSLNDSELSGVLNLNETEFFINNRINDSKLHQSFHLQTKQKFGENMKDAITWVFSKNISKLIVLGADTPHIQPKILNQSLSLLRQYPVILGPSAVAGIYLIGLTPSVNLRGLETVFKNLELSNFAKFIGNQEFSFAMLEELTDIDQEADLIGLISWLEAAKIANQFNNNFKISIPINTHNVIQSLQLIIEYNENDNRKKQIMGKQNCNQIVTKKESK